MKYAGLGAVGLVGAEYGTVLANAQDITRRCPVPPCAGAFYIPSLTASHISAHASYTNALIARIATSSQAYNAYQAAIAHFNNLYDIGLVGKYQTKMQGGYQPPTANQLQSVYNYAVNNYSSRIPYSDATHIVQPDPVSGQQAYNLVLSSGGIWTSYNNGVAYEKARTAELQPGAPKQTGNSCSLSASNVETMFTGIAAVFGVAALIDPPALAVSAAAMLVSFGAIAWNRYYCN